MGPVRLYTPYKRRRRNPRYLEEKRSKVKRDVILGDSDVDNIHQTSNNSSHSKEAWQTIAEGLEGNTDYHLLENPEGSADPTIGESYTQNVFVAKNNIRNDNQLIKNIVPLEPHVMW